MSHIAINIPNGLLQRYANSTRSFRSAVSNSTRTNTSNTHSSFRSAQAPNNNNNNNVHVVNTNDPNRMKKEGVNNSYNMNVESRKKWLARQKGRKTRKFCASRRQTLSGGSASLAIASHSQHPVRLGERDALRYIATRKSGRRATRRATRRA